MRVALVLLLLSSAAAAEPAGLEATAELDYQWTDLHSTDGGLNKPGPRVELGIEERASRWWSYGGMVAVSHIPGDLGSTQYHIAITGGEYGLFAGTRVRGWFGPYVCGALGLGLMEMVSGSAHQSSGFVDGEVAIEPLKLGHWAVRLVAGVDLYVFDDISNTAWLGAAVVYR